MEIESRYPEDSKLFHRKFTFEPTKNGIENHSHEEVNGINNRFTEVRLKGLKQDYQKWCNTDAEDIAIKIIEHCFVYFLRDDCPRITLHDGDRKIVVNDLFGVFTKGQVINKPLKIRDEKFEVNIVKLYSSRLDNKIHYCAHTREVENDKMNGEIPELDSFIYDENDQKFCVAAYVSGTYLDIKVNEERTSIHFAEI